MANAKLKKIESYLVPGKRVHLVGIGGVSMRPLALVLAGMGLQISGSDMNASVSTDELIEKNIRVYIGHSAKNIADADCLIRTAAVHNDNPEIAAARAKGIPVFERAQAWGVIMRAYRHAICVAGTHGKTTTTSMITHIFMQAQRDPTVMIGGYLPLLKAGHRVGGGDTIIMESCEYCNSFLNFFPTMAVIMNVEADHLDFFKDLADIQHSFRTFAELVPSTGAVLANGDDSGARVALEGLDYVTFGIEDTNFYHGANYSDDWRDFDLIADGQAVCHIHLNVFGRHNALNAIAACAAALRMGVDPADIQAGLESFTGAGRRMEFKGKCNGADVYDDYAHHPGELHALIDAINALGYKRVMQRRRRLRRLRPPSRRAARPHRRHQRPGLQARHRRLPAPYLFPHQSSVRRLRPGTAPGGSRGAGGDLRRPREQHHRHLLGGPVPADPRLGLLRDPAGGDGLSALHRPARRPDRHRRRRRHLQGGRSPRNRIIKTNRRGSRPGFFVFVRQNRPFGRFSYCTSGRELL